MTRNQTSLAPEALRNGFHHLQMESKIMAY